MRLRIVLRGGHRNAVFKPRDFWRWETLSFAIERRRFVFGDDHGGGMFDDAGRALTPRREREEEEEKEDRREELEK